MKALLAILLVPLAAGATAADPRHGADAEARFTEADLRPLFASGALARSSADLAAERWKAAAAGFARSSAPAARYARAIALIGDRRGAEAATALEGLDEGLPDLADRIAFWRGRAYQLAGDHARAAAAYARVGEGSLLWADAQLSRARELEAAGDRSAAFEALARILSLPPPDEVTRSDAAAEALLLGGRLRARGSAGGDLPWARRAFIDCWAGHPLSAAAASCMAELNALPEPENAPPSAEDSLRRAEGLLDANRNASALEQLRVLAGSLPEPGPGQAMACRARFALGKALRKERQHASAMEALQPVVERCEDPQLRVKALYVLASAAAVVAPEQGIAWYRLLARDFPAHPFADDALFFAADLLARAGRNDEALATYAELSERYPHGDYRPEALFRIAWLERSAGHHAGALAALSRLEGDYEQTDPYEHSRALYWKGRVLAERNDEGDAARAREAWRAVADRHPTDYYGLLSRARLDESSPGSAPAWPRAATAVAAHPLRYQVGALVADRHFRAGVLLLRMGLGRAAAEELSAVSRQALGSGDGLLLVAELLDRADDHKASTRLIRSAAKAALREKPEGAVLRIWRVAYPSAFRQEVQRWARPAGVPPELLLALMREESGLDPSAVSGAGAVGLTQVMLPTAQGVATKLKMGRIHNADLMKPHVAIRIGATYLGDLLRRYGSEALALAAYNAGDVPVRRWLRERGTLPLDAFVEEIPIQETRGYVKRVLRSYAVYQYLYGTKEAKPVLLRQAMLSRAP